MKNRAISTFNSIADRYILANHLLSFGQDICWRKTLCSEIQKNVKHSHTVIDVACGTGENFRYCSGDFDIKVGLDPARQMLKIAKKRFPDIYFIEGVAEQMPFSDNTADLITVSFGVRNFENRSRAFKEFFRVLKKDGILAILEFFPMENGSLINKLASFYIYNLIPYFGGAVTGNFNAYKYLSKSIKNFIMPNVMKLEIENSGIKVIKMERLFPNVYIFIGKKL